jgi:uncharacterized protein (TIGR02646 family)
MMRLLDTLLDAEVLTQLNTWQGVVDGAGDYAAQVTMAKSEFGKRNVKGNATFDAVKVALIEICSGAQRCCYCEDSCADEVEHLQPKDLYPQVVFVWDNYAYACGPCNSPKNNKFAVFVVGTGVKTDVTRPHDAPVVAPIAGSSVLINPREEDPFDFMYLDVLGTFRFEPLEDDTSKQSYQRAAYTIELLGLNRRSYLVKARREAYGSYRARLKEYISKRNQGEDTEHYIAGIIDMGHPSVWEAMVRFHARIPELKELFDDAPEALRWKKTR